MVITDEDKMASIIPEMTEKMQYLYTDVMESLLQMPCEQRAYIFGVGEDEDPDWIIGLTNYIVLEYIKYSFDYSDPVYPLRHFLQEIDADDSERMRQSRIVHYAMKYKKRKLEETERYTGPDHKFSNIDMDSMEDKLKGYKFTEMNFFEHQNIHDLDIIKAIAEKRIVSVKKVSNARFVEIFDQYDDLVEKLIERSKKSDEDMVFTSIAFFTLEWHYALEAFYIAACIMEEYGITEVDLDTLALLCAEVHIESRFGGSVSTTSRIVKERLLTLDYLLSPNVSVKDKAILKNMIKEIIVIYVNYMECVPSTEGGLYKDWFRENSDMSDWASFLRYYDLFSIWQKKNWTRTRIQNMRKIINAMFIEPL